MFGLKRHHIKQCASKKYLFCSTKWIGLNLNNNEKKKTLQIMI